MLSYECKNIFFDFSLAVINIPFVIVFILTASIILPFSLKSLSLFAQEGEITLNRYRFNIYKLRTNKSLFGPDSKLNSHNFIYKLQKKYSIPGFAGWLRRAGLDEIPQVLYEKHESMKTDLRILTYTLPVLLIATNNDVIIHDKSSTKKELHVENFKKIRMKKVIG